jgi:outer membrane lipoprotein-sorting protein
MNDAAKRLRTISAQLGYTTVTVVVNDKSTESGQFYMRNPKNPEILIRFEKPDAKTILFNRSRAQIYYPTLNRIEQYDLERQSSLVQQFLLLGFGTDSANLKMAYDVKLAGEEDLAGESVAVLELTPRNPQVASQLTSIKLWISEDSWIPVQQQFNEPGGDYLIARYTDEKVNKPLSSSIFQIHAAAGAQTVKKN